MFHFPRLLAFGQGWSSPVPALAGFGLWLQGPIQPLLLLGPLDGAGQASVQLTVPALPAGSASHTFWIQGANLDPAGTAALGLNPGTLALLP